MHGFLSDTLAIVSSPNSLYFWGWWALFAAGAFFVQGGIRQAFPASVYNTDSARIDYKYFILMIVLRPVLAGTIFYAGAERIAVGLGQAAGILRPIEPNSLSAQLAYTVISLLAMDFAYTLFHFACHRVPALWSLHKVHHSAEQLNPLTNERVHPLEHLLEYSFVSLFLVASSLFSIAVFGAIPSGARIGSVSVAILVFSALPHLNHFRHSHVWISYGPLNLVFSSPAMHQIHHSSDPAHYDRNFARLFPVFDALLGTLWIPREKLELRFGLTEEDQGARRFDTLAGSLGICALSRHFRLFRSRRAT